MEFWDVILFEMGGKPVLLIDLLSAMFGLTTVFLAGRNRKSNFYVGYLYTALLFFMFWQKNLYANLILQPISLESILWVSTDGAIRRNRRKVHLETET